ncbi:hypothetical protein [Novosphingobium aquimarinum]|uniref:hypothetical protein n=1 Tax=Novosphingobium aquimarinum TaxID=2682494 RepID=UPI0012EB7FA1|nr:hypothetical protein [Novosphingobium aquimarinum]
MKTWLSLTPLAVPLALVLVSACSSPEPAASDDAGLASEAAMPSAPALPSGMASSETQGTSASTAPSDTITLEGLGDLVIGKPVPAGSSFAVRGAQIPDSTCKTLSSPDYPGVYAMVNDDEVRRISVGGTSPVKLVEGIGPGSSEKAVLKAFPSFQATPHQYVAAPAKYLTQPGKDPRLRFEIEGGKVSVMHVGLMPELGYVEGCA